MTAALNHIMKKTLYLLSLLLAVIATSCGGDSQIGKNFNEIEGASSSYRIRDQKNGEEYQVITLQTIPNKEYTITSANGKKRTFVDDEPLNLLGVADMTGKIIVPMEFGKIREMVDGNVLVEMSNRLAGYYYRGIYKNGEIVVEPIYHSLEIDSNGNGALATISNDDGRTQQIYAYDFKNGYKKTLLPLNSLLCSIRDGKIHIRAHNKSTRRYEDYWFDFSGNEIPE